MNSRYLQRLCRARTRPHYRPVNVRHFSILLSRSLRTHREKYVIGSRIYVCSISLSDGHRSQLATADGRTPELHLKIYVK